MRGDFAANRLGGLERSEPIGLPGLSEPEAIRHYVRLSQKNYSIDTGIFPLGSCTMKHNPRLNEKMARLPGFADIHPLQPEKTVQGALALMQELSRWLLELTGMQAVALSPKAGAHGELCGMVAIRAALEARGEADTRRVVLVPEFGPWHQPGNRRPARLHGPRRACPRGWNRQRRSGARGARPGRCRHDAHQSEHLRAVRARYRRDRRGAFTRPAPIFYCDGANFNAIVGKARPGDLGVDAMHINLHKTFSTPHGGGGPGSGPVVLSPALAPFAPLPLLVHEGEGFRLVEHAERQAAEPFGRMTAFHGQMGMFVRALAYMLSHGADGVRQASEDAVLYANYMRARLHDA